MKHPNSLLAVYNGQVDAGALASNAVDMVSVDLDQIEILWRSDPIYRGPWVARSGLSEERIESIRAALIEISSREDAATIFEQSTTKGFVDGADGDYDVIREVLRVPEDFRTIQEAVRAGNASTTVSISPEPRSGAWNQTRLLGSVVRWH